MIIMMSDLWPVAAASKRTEAAKLFEDEFTVSLLLLLLLLLQRTTNTTITITKPKLDLVQCRISSFSRGHTQRFTLQSIINKDYSGKD
jgi:hypothetical protein